MADFNYLKKQAKKKLEDAKADLEKSIEEKEKVVELLKKDFDFFDKFVVGNLIKRDPEKHYYPYCLIVGEPEYKNGEIVVPIRNNIFPDYDVEYCCIRWQIGVELFRIPVNELNTIKVITVRELFEENKEKYRKVFKGAVDRYECTIRDCEKGIKACKERIESYEESIKKYKEKIENYKTLVFEDVYAKNVETYLKSEGYKQSTMYYDKK